ncbi:MULTISPECIES: DUF1850 domain-containing protein [Salinibaculum]|uniref:DUF1850 domain-containing protein n=1 Tax=Salinibaculum TaxID=2732368 RepID=UPI0030CBE059
MKRTLARAVPFLVALGVVLIAFVAVAPAESVLVVEDTETGEQYITESVENGTIVGLRYMHSVEKTPVYDEYRIEGQTLVNTRMEFESYGWGLPARVNVTNVNGTLVYDPPEPIVELQSLSVSPGRIAGHTLTVGNHSYDLVAATNASGVRIHIERRSLIDLFT